MIVVTGATGRLGSLAVAELLAAGVRPDQIIATGRERTKLEELSALCGVHTRYADMQDPDTLASAFAGADKLLLVSTTDVGLRIGNHRRAIDAAKSAGVQLIAYTSALNAATARMRLAHEHRLTEEYLQESGIPCVVLRNGWYLENYTELLPSILEQRTLPGAAGDGLVAAASRRDFAAAAAAVLTNEGHAGTVYELGGDAFTLSELAATISDVSRIPVAYSDLSPESYAAALVSTGLPQNIADVLSDADSGLSRGELYTASDDLRRLIGRSATTAREAVADALSR